MDEAELAAIVDAAIAEAGATSPRELGAVMKLVMARTEGRADGKAVSALVRSAPRRLSGRRGTLDCGSVARETLTVSDELARELASRSDEVLRRPVGPPRRARVPARRPADPGRRGRADGAGARGRRRARGPGRAGPADRRRRRSTRCPACWPRTAAPSTSSTTSSGGTAARRSRPKTVNQKRYVDSIRRSTITFGIGPAGTGKTYLAIALAVAALVDREVSRIILTRPAVEAGERLGFLPGDIAAKVDPYLRPLFDALMDMLDSDRVQQYLEKGIVEVAPLAFMRGRTLNDSFIILDEAQNTTPEQMQMFLTRLGFGSQVVVTGDVTQIDLPRGQGSGLIEVREILEDIPDIEFVLFDRQDVVRHKIVQRIVDAYRIDAERRGDIR